MLQAIPNGWFSTAFTLYRDERFVGDLDLPMRKFGRLFSHMESMEFHVEGRTYELHVELRPAPRVPLIAKWPELLVTCEGKQLMRAEPRISLVSFFTVHAEGRQFDLKGSFLSLRRKIRVFEAGRQIGSIFRGIWSRMTTIDLPEEIPLPVRVFLFWLALCRWRSAASSGGS